MYHRARYIERRDNDDERKAELLLMANFDKPVTIINSSTHDANAAALLHFEQWSCLFVFVFKIMLFVLLLLQHYSQKSLYPMSQVMVLMRMNAPQCTRSAQSRMVGMMMMVIWIMTMTTEFCLFDISVTRWSGGKLLGMMMMGGSTGRCNRRCRSHKMMVRNACCCCRCHAVKSAQWLHCWEGWGKAWCDMIL